MRQVIQLANDSHPVFSLRYIYWHRMRWWWQLENVYECAWMHVFAWVTRMLVYVHMLALLLHQLCESVCEKHVSLRTAVFLPQQWSHPVGAQADASCLFQSSDFVCVCVCVFFVEEENIAWLEPAASPVGLKFACFPPICSMQPNQRQHCLLVCS